MYAKENMAIVAHKDVGNTKESFFKAVNDVMELANWKENIGDIVFLKLNCVSDRVIPGQCTSPWVFEAVIKKLKTKKGIKIYAGDSYTVTNKQIEKCFKAWGYEDIAKKYDVVLVNLSKQLMVKKNIGGEIFKELEIPKLLLDVDSIVSLPVLKTHYITKMTFSLKNQWGCITGVRQKYHTVASQCIAELNKFLKVSFAIGDASICSEGHGPRVGKPKIMNSVLASNDLVALDSVGAKMIGMNEVEQIKYSCNLGVGDVDYQIKGDKIKIEKFEPAILKTHIISLVEMNLRKVPVLNKIIFDTPLFKIPAYLTAKMNDLWYHRKGRFLPGPILKNKMYNEEFKNLI